MSDPPRPWLSGRVVLITGTGGGQGRAAAIRFAREGATVVGCDLKVDGQRETDELVRSAGGITDSTAPVDLGDSRQAHEWVDEAAKRHGGIDVLYNNASAPRFGSIAEMSDDDWHFTIRNELDLIFYTCRAAWPHLIARGGGSIINVGSIAGLSAQRAVPGQFAHAATKGGVISMTRELAREGAPHRIRANSLSPGYIDTPATAGQWEDPAMLKQALDSQMVERLGRPDDIAEAALYLARAEWVTGTNLVVDGGFTAW